jgi:hypothetical protein
MAQTRYVNFGDTVLAQRINEISTAIVVPAVLEGAEMSVGLGGKSVNIAPHKVMLNELLLIEDATINLVVGDTLPVDPTDYTVVYEHNNQQVQGGVPALLLIIEGLVGFDTLANTIVVGWIRWTGVGTALQPEMFIEAPKLQITNPTEFTADTIVPPFVPRIYVRATTPDPGDIVATDVFDVVAFGAGQVGAAHMELDNTSPSDINTITHLFPFVAGIEPPNRVIIEANVPLGGSVEVSLVDEEGTQYPAITVAAGTIINTSSQYEFREVQILNVDTTKFAQNRPYYVQVFTQLNSGKQAQISIVGASSNFLPI